MANPGENGPRARQRQALQSDPATSDSSPPCQPSAPGVYFSPGEHPPPHFHVYYNEHKGIVNITACEFLEGDIPRRQARLALAWAELHQEELMADWNLVMNGEEPFKIQPLQ